MTLRTRKQQDQTVRRIDPVVSVKICVICVRWRTVSHKTIPCPYADASLSTRAPSATLPGCPEHREFEHREFEHREFEHREFEHTASIPTARRVPCPT
jgi:hypothetical protein